MKKADLQLVWKTFATATAIILLMLFFVKATGIQKLQKKNVLIFVVDDLGYYDLSSHGSKLYETPNIDKLAKEGIEFDHAYASHPRCTPSRYAIQTGKFPARNQIPGPGDALAANDTSIGQAFKDNGYHTFFAGKWHLGKKETDWPQYKGYDINKGGCSAGAPISYFYPYNVSRDKNKKGEKHHRPIIGLDDGKPGEYLTDRLTQETIRFIKENKNRPFFAMLCHYGVHTPFQAPKALIQKYKAKVSTLHFSGPDYLMKDGQTKTHQDNYVYAAMIESVDKSLGKIINVLKQEGILNNTIIVFTSDHGGLSNRGINSHRELATANLPLRAGKGHVYEGGIQVPFIIYDPGLTPKHHCEQVTVNTDIYPTLLDLCGLPLKPRQHIDGISMKTFMQTGKTVDRILFWHSPKGRPNQTGDHTCSAIRVGNYKLIDYYPQHRLELYNLKKDPGETNNLVQGKKELAKKLDKELNDWKTQIHAYEKTKKKLIRLN
jgi:arylsulfatase A-like enzyme